MGTSTRAARENRVSLVDANETSWTSLFRSLRKKTLEAQFWAVFRERERLNIRYLNHLFVFTNKASNVAANALSRKTNCIYKKKENASSSLLLALASSWLKFSTVVDRE